MMALSRTAREPESGEIESLLPWHAAGTLNAWDMRRVGDALASDGELARQYGVIREEYAETIALNESLGVPSARAMQKLFVAIAAEPPRRRHAARRLSARFAGFLAGLWSRALARSWLRRQGPPRALVRFAPDACMADITILLDRYQASMIGGPKGGLLRLQFGDETMSKERLADLMSHLQREKIVTHAVATL